MIATTVADGVGTITIDRPERRNALTSDGLASLEAAVRDLEGRATVLYLHGAGEAFCAGADLDEVAAMGREDAAAFARRGQRVARTIADSPAPVVAGIDGAARGGGLELALACDLRVATPAATLGEPGVALGLFGAWGGTVRLPRVVGEGEALDLALSGRVVDGESALRMGLVSRMESDPRAVATELAAHPPDALEAIKRRLRDRRDREGQEDREAEAFAALVAAGGGELADRRRD